MKSSSLKYDFPVNYPTGFIIFEANTYKLSFCIERCGPEQIQLKNGHLVATSESYMYLEIIELQEKSYNKIQKIDIYGSPVLFGLHPNGNFTVLSEDSTHTFWLSHYQPKGNEYIRLTGQFGISIHAKVWHLKTLNDKIVMYNYNNNGFQMCDITTKEKSDVVELKDGIEIDKGDETIVKITDNLIAMICSNNICIFNINKRQITHTIQVVNNAEDYLISCLLAFDEKNLIVSYMDKKQKDNYLCQYEIQEEGEKLITEKKLSSLKSYKIIRKIADDKLLLLSNPGKLIILSKDSH